MTEQNKLQTVRFPLPNSIIALIKRIEQSGEEAYLVGGSLRDLMLGIEPHDFDLATSALPEKTRSLFADFRVIDTGLQHGTVTVLVDGEPVEITTFRIDGAYSDSRHPDQVVFTNRIVEDLARRDFTVNAMAYHPERGLVDPFGGREDLKKKCLRAVGNAELRFGEDALRIMRAFRFCAQLGFSIEQDTLLGAKRGKFGLTSIARERIASEFLRLLTSDFAERAVREMIECEVLSYVVGDYRPSDRLLSRLHEMPRDEVARLGCFFAESDRETTKKILRSLKLSNKHITGACAIVSGSHTPIQTPADARRLIASCGVYAPLAVRVSVLLGINDAQAIEWSEQKDVPCTVSDLNIGGRDLLMLGVEPKNIGKILEFLLACVLEEPSLNQKETLLAMAAERKNKMVSID